MVSITKQNRQNMDIEIVYHNKSKEIEKKLSQLKKVVKKHYRVFERNPNNSGYLRDLINLENRIDEVLHFTGLN